MQWKPTLKHVPAASVPYGEQITRRGDKVWAAYSDDELIAIGATAKEARAKYARARQGNLRASYLRTEGRLDKPHALEPGEPIGIESNGEYIERIRKGRPR